MTMLRVLQRVTAMSLGLVVGACNGLTDSSHNFARLKLFVSPEHATAAPVDSPFVSVIDSIHLVIHDSGTKPRAFGQPVRNGQKNVPLEVEVLRGRLELSVSVLGSTGVALFSGDTTVFVDSDDFTLRVGVHALRPVMVLSPDTTSTTVVDPKNANASVTVHNRGLDSLFWRIKSLPAGYSACNQNCLAAPDSGRLGAGDSQVLSFFVPVTFPAQLYCYVLTSAEGDATVCWKRN